MLLTHAQARVLGSLVEKGLATPQQYPLSENALLAACNQATNRDPVVSYDIGVVRRALKGLREHGLAKEVHRPGERVSKHRHLLDEAMELGQAEVAVLCVLLLRGPQTVAELRARTERLHPFTSSEEVQDTLDPLASRSPDPLVEHLERRPGQKEARWGHLLIDPLAEDEPPGSPAAGTSGLGEAGDDAGPPGQDTAPRVSLTVLARTVDELQARIEQLEAELDAMRGAGEPGGGTPGAHAAQRAPRV